MKKILLFLFAFALLAICASARAETACERSWLKWQTGVAPWNRHCGPEPGKLFADELRKDCAITRARIRSREGASWNSEYGWAAESTCDALDREGEA